MSVYLITYRNYLERVRVYRYETIQDADRALALPDADQAVSGFVASVPHNSVNTSTTLLQDLLDQWRKPDEPEHDLGTHGKVKQRFFTVLESTYGHIPLSVAPALPAPGAPAAETNPAPTMETAMAKKAKKTPKAKKEANGPKAPRALKQGMVFALKGFVLKNPGITDEDLMAKLKGDGFKPAESSVATFRQDFVHSLRFLNLQGYKVPEPG